jgi:hypothetical protein
MEKSYERQYDVTPPKVNLSRLERIEALRFWVAIHQWELDEMLQTGSDFEEYPKQGAND